MPWGGFLSVYLSSSPLFCCFSLSTSSRSHQIRHCLVVDDESANTGLQPGRTPSWSVLATANDGKSSFASAAVVIAEPRLAVSLANNGGSFARDAFDAITLTATVSHNSLSTAPAYRVRPHRCI
jgi:hypothetical protein